jgi:hypothetical protein
MAEDAPALLLRPKMQGELSWYRRAGSETECIAVFKITLENIGKSPIELTEATVGVWRLSIPEKEIDYIDPLKLTNGVAPSAEGNLMPPKEPSLDRKAFLRTYYPPGVADELGMMFLLKRDPGKIALFIAEGKYRIRGTENDDGWFWHEWDEVCGLESLPEAAKDSSSREKRPSRPVSTPRPTE